MQEPILRKLFLGFIQVHILHHAQREPVFGVWMMEELQHHGYEMSAGTLYPILHTLERSGLLRVENRIINGKVRKYYAITPDGEAVLREAKAKAAELLHEIQ